MTVAELADHEARVSTGDQPTYAVADVQRARQLVVRTQLSHSWPSESERRRRKRTVDQPSAFNNITYKLIM